MTKFTSDFKFSVTTDTQITSTPTVVLKDATDQTKSLTWTGCTVDGTTNTIINCSGIPSEASGASPTASPETYKIASVTDPSTESTKQTFTSITFGTPSTSLEYKAPYTLGNNVDTTIDHKTGETAKTYTVNVNGLTGTNGPTIKIGSTVDTTCAWNNGVATCTPTKEIAAVSETAYTIYIVDPCNKDVEAGMTVKITDTTSNSGGNENPANEVTVNQATYTPSCVTAFSETMSISVAIANAKAATPKITLTSDDETPNTLEWTCPVITGTSETITCTGEPSTSAANRKYGNYSLSAVSDTAATGATFKAPASPTNFFQYKQPYTLGTNANQTVDYDDDEKLNFTVTFTGMTGTDAPGIKLGSKSVSNCSLADSVVTCFPTKEEVPKSDDPYELKYVDPCGVDVTTGKYVEVSTSFALKASSLALVIAMFIL